MLTLNVINKPDDANLAVEQVVFDEQGGNVGRAEHCDLILPDPHHFVSKIHALIHFRDHMYFVTDVSSNGVFVNASTVPVGKGNTKQILEGDRLRIGNYLLQASFKTATPQELVLTETAASHLDDEIESILKKSHSLDDLLTPEVTHKPQTAALPADYKNIDDLLASIADDTDMIELDSLDSSPADLIDLIAPSHSVSPYQQNVFSSRSANNAAKTPQEIYQAIMDLLLNDSFSQHFDPEVLAELHKQLVAHQAEILNKIS